MRVFLRHHRYNLRSRKRRAQRLLEVLPKAGPSKPRELTEAELQALQEKEELTLMELRIFLREVLNKLGNDKKFSIFTKPVNIDDAPDYYEVIEQPMDMSTMMAKIDLHEYNTVHAFMDDVNLICSNALEYNPNRGPMDRVIRHRACALKDTAYAIIKTELDKDFEKMCMEIEESRKRRGKKSSTVPNYYYTKPSGSGQQSRASQPVIPSYLEQHKPVRSIPEPEGERFSRRLRGLTIDPTPPLEAVEKVYKAVRAGNSPNREGSANSSVSQQNNSGPKNEVDTNRSLNSNNLGEKSNCSSSVRKDSKHSTPKISSNTKSDKDSKRKKTTKCVWCRPKRKRARLTFSRPPPKEQQEQEEETEDEDTSQEEEEEGGETEDNKPSVEDQLSVQVQQEEETIKELKSPALSTRGGRRRSSPGLSSPPVSQGVSTRRSSMSPRGGGSQETSAPGLVHHSQTAELSHSPLKPLPELAKEAVPVIGSEPAASLAPPEDKPAPEKPSVVKRLDMDSVVVDSGMGSSLESNGDSRDSTDHSARLADTNSKPLEVIEKDQNESCNSLQSRANAELQDNETKTLRVDTGRLQALLHKLVSRTEGMCVERLEKVYSQMSMVVHRHRHAYDRTPMIQELERKCEDLIHHNISSSSGRSKHQ